MATATNTELNATQALNVIDGLSMNIDTNIQYLLMPIYSSKYGSFFTTEFFGVPLGQLIAALIIFSIFILLRKLFTTIITSFLQKLAKRTTTYYDDKVISALKDPIAFMFIIIGMHLFFLIIFYEPDFIKNILNTLIVFTVFWAIIATAEALKGLIYHATARINKDLAKEMGNFILTIIKILVGGIGLGAMLQVWGINVTALVASLGIGGLAFALAAKDTASNLFGSFSILVDKSIRIGEWIKVDGIEGTVEDIGMRTTKIRTFQKSLITIPNQIVANNPIENYSRRGIRRVKLHVGITYGTTASQIKNIVSELKTMLESHDEIFQKETLLVNLESFGDSSINILIYAFTSTSNWQKYLDIREDIHLQILEIVENNDSSFAFPSQSIYIEQIPSKEPIDI